MSAGIRLIGLLLAVISAALSFIEVRHAKMHSLAQMVITQNMPTTASVEASSDATTDAVSKAAFVRDQAVLSLFLAERCLVVGDRKMLDSRIGEASATLMEALKLNPSDGNLWLMAYWMQVVGNGPSVYGISLLEASYTTAPYEGWMAMRRSRLAWAVFPILPSSLKAKVKSEFLAFIRSNYFDHAASLIIGPAWPYREGLLRALSDFPVSLRLLFSVKLQRLGYFLPLRDVVLPEVRPWKRICGRQGPDNRGGVCL